jgi:CHAT domain-containing protein
MHAQLAASRGKSDSERDLVAFADPVSGEASLPQSRREVETISRIFPRSLVLLGERASPLQAKTSLKGARYVHFACHGVSDDRFPLDSALLLSPPAGDLAGEGGRLAAWQIFEHVRLDAELVALSACRSASGAAFAGEGLLGLTRAFQYAGARSVLASLWATGDSSTARLMAAFYTGLKAGIAKDEALRQAQRQAIRRGWHPVRWANFQLYGDWR